MLVLSIWTTMNSQQQWNPRAFYVSHRIGEQTVNLRAIFTLKTDLFRGSEIELSQQSVVLLRELAQRISFPNV